MSILFKNHFILPTYKLSETITQSQSSECLTSKVLITAAKNHIANRQITQVNNSQPIEQQEANTLPQISTRRKKAANLITFRTKPDDNFSDYLQHVKNVGVANKTKLTKTKHDDTSSNSIKEANNKFRKLQEERRLEKEQGREKKLKLNIRYCKETGIDGSYSLQLIDIPFDSLPQFTQSIYTSIKEYLNNSRKLYQVVRHLIGLRSKNLKRILLHPTEEELVDYPEISRKCCIKEQVIVHGETKYVDKFDISLADDINYIIEAIENLLLHKDLNAIKQISSNIIAEEEEISKLSQQLGQFKVPSKLSVQSIAMQRYQPHHELDSIEKRLGPLALIPRQLRQTSQVLGEIIYSLNDNS